MTYKIIASNSINDAETNYVNNEFVFKVPVKELNVLKNKPPSKGWLIKKLDLDNSQVTCNPTGRY